MDELEQPFSVRLRKAAALTKLPSITAYLEENETGTAPSIASGKLYKKTFAIQRFVQRFRLKKELFEGHGEPTKEDLDIAAAAGTWSTRPSDLFLKIYADCLVTLQRDPLAGVVSPPLLGSEGTVPLSIVSVIPDIMQHYYDCIVRAEYEVVLLTNYWQPSASVRKIGSAIKELSRRQGLKNKKVIFKLLIDRGALKQVINPHVDVPPNEWKPLDIPLPSDIPNVQLEVQNYHRLVLGTMHTKFLVVDRIVACLNSNNIQDRPNLEMMVHLEGPIVQSLYDTGLITWHEKMKPPLPLLKQPKPQLELTFAEDNPFLADIDLVKAAKAAKAILHKQATEAKEEGQQLRAKSGSAIALADVVAAVQKSRSKVTKLEESISALSSPTKSRSTSSKTLVKENGHRPEEPTSLAPADATSRPHEEDIVLPLPSPAPGAQATTSGSPRPPSVKHALVNGSRARAASDVSVISNPGVAFSHARSSPSTKATTVASKLATPDMANLTLPPPAEATSTTSMTELTDSAFAGRMRNLSANFNKGANAPTKASLPLELYDDHWQFEPHRFHKAHEPVPIALVNRKPHGMPGHKDIRNPQDAAWLAALRYAQKHVFIQTPTLNAKKIREAILKACRRKVKVILYIDLGFNDKSEGGVPFQGGTNQDVVKRLYAALDAEHKPFLELYWYTGADQRRPLHAIHKRRNCHVKFLSCDSQIAIVGNGNQDTQSWCHSQEVNILIDSEQIVLDWENMLASNQNTGRFGRTGDDGIWRDINGKTVEELDAVELTALTSQNENHQPPVEQKREPLANDAA